jgi:hypothetical protein
MASAADKGQGWITFAGLMLILAGALDVLNGLWALGTSDTQIDALFYDNNLDAWGWFYLIVGIVIVLAGFAVFARAGWAVTVGIAVGLIGATLNMLWIFQYPIASIVLVSLNVLVVYGLVVYGINYETD